MVKTKKGFTLIELLVVITIIGILSAIGINIYEDSQAKARDTKRKEDIDQVIKAVQSYINDNGQAPLAGSNYGGDGSCVAGQLVFGCALTSADGATIYMPKVPTAPKNNVTACGIGISTPCRYYYFQSVPAGTCTGSAGAGITGKPYVSTYMESTKGNGDDCLTGYSNYGLYFKIL